MATNPSSPARNKKPAKDGPVKTLLFKTLGYTVLFLVFGPLVIGLPYGVYIQFVSLKDDIWLNSQGALAPRSHVYYYRHATKYRSETFCVSYATQQGQEHDQCVDYAIAIIGIDTHQPMIVHYNPDSPEHISTSWGRQKLISRTLFFFFTCLMTLVIELGVTYEIIKKFMGWDAPGAGLRADALQLSGILDKIIYGLQAQSGANAAYGQAIAAELTPLVAQYNHAALGSSRDEASRALDEVVACMNDFKRNRKSQHIHLGFRHWMDMRRYERFTDIFRQTRYRDDAL